MSNLPIQSLWIGDSLSALENLSINSFLKHGYEFHLYCYEEVSNIPRGVMIKDARSILAPEKIFKYRDYDSYAGFSNLFRYKLLLDKGGYWVDLDIVCLRPFTMDDDYVFASERKQTINGYHITNCIIKAPMASPIMEYCFTIAVDRDPIKLKWGETGPLLLAEAVQKFNLASFVAVPQIYCPIDYWSWDRLFYEENKSGFKDMVSDGTQAVHFWNEMLRRNNINKDQDFASDVLFEQLKSLYLPGYAYRNKWKNVLQKIKFSISL